MASAKERAARARAARCYAALSQADIARELQISVETVSRLENARRELSTDEALTIAQACGVPVAFMERGWDAIPADPRTAQTAAIEHRLERIEDALRALVSSSEHPRSEGGGLPAMPGDLGRRLQAVRRILEGLEPPESNPGPGRRAGGDG